MTILDVITGWWRGPAPPCECKDKPAMQGQSCRLRSAVEIEADKLQQQVAEMTKANGIATMEAVQTSHRAITVEHAARDTLSDLMRKMDRGQ